MANSKIVITFNSIPTDGDIIKFDRFLFSSGSGTGFVQKEMYIDKPRVEPYYITIPATPTTFDIAALFVTYFNLDYNGYGLYTISRVGNVVTIEFTNQDWGFENPSASFASFVITNITPSTFALNSNSTSASSTDICGKYSLDLDFNEDVVEYKINSDSPVVGTFVSPFSIELNRGIPYTIDFKNASGDVVNLSLGQIDTLSVSNTYIVQLFDISGTEVNVIVNNRQGLALEYSLNDVDWQTSQVFQSQAPGNYTVYIRDQYGCKISIQYEVLSEVSTRNPFIKISEQNSLIFYKQEVVDGVTSFRNDENRLEFQSDAEIISCMEVLFTNQDKTKIQFKSNYDTPSVKLRKDDLTEVTIPITKQTSNLNRFSKLDCTYYQYRPGLIGVYFTSGNTYDQNDVVTGTYALNGNLPDFAIIGNTIKIEGFGLFRISDKIFDRDINKQIIVLESTITVSTTQSKISSYYDLLNFEVYEFEIDWSIFGNGLYDVLITNTDTNNGTVYHLSENIIVADSFEQTLAIRYYNNNNRDIFYKYGIEHFIRIPYLSRKKGFLESSDINIGDRYIAMNKSKLNKTDTFKFEELTEGMMTKLVIALSSENLFINNVGYLKSNDISVENIENTNLYDVEVELIQTGFTYSTVTNDKQGADADVIDFNIPAIITDGTNFIKS